MHKQIKTLFITGAGGFLGSFLVKYFDPRYRVLGSDRKAKKSLNIFKLDLSCEHDLNASMFADVDILIHCAGLAHGKSGEHDFYEINAEGTRRVVSTALSGGVSHVIFISSMAVYDTSRSRVIINSTTPENPTSDYGGSKLKAENIARELCVSAAVPLTIIRPSLIFDTKAPGNLALLRKAIEKKFPIFVSRQANSRDLITLDGIAEIIEDAISNPSEGTRILLGANITMSLEEIILSLSDSLGMRPRVIRVFQSIINILFIMPLIKSIAFKLYGDLIIDVREANIDA